MVTKMAMMILFIIKKKEYFIIDPLSRTFFFDEHLYLIHTYVFFPHSHTNILTECMYNLADINHIINNSKAQQTLFSRNMPKKWGVNDKKQAAREKEKLQKEEKRLKAEEEKERKEWEETDKHALKKLERKQKAAEKKEAEQKRKLEKKELYEKEMKELGKGEKPPKITQYEAEKIKQQVIKETIKKAEPPKDEWLQENVNRLKAAEEAKLAAEGVKLVSATGLAEAVEALTIDDPDRHPERRMKKAYEDYVDKMMPKIKAEYPGLKRSQYLNMIQKEWKTAPENPMNGPTIAYNSKV